MIGPPTLSLLCKIPMIIRHFSNQNRLESKNLHITHSYFNANLYHPSLAVFKVGPFDSYIGVMSPLPLEIWSLVAGQVCFLTAQDRPNILALITMLKVHAAGGTRDLLALCLVSRQVHDVAAAWLYRSLILDLDLSKKPLQLLAERMTSRTAYHVREFKASSGILCVFLGCHDSEFKMLRSVIQRLPALRRFK